MDTHETAAPSIKLLVVDDDEDIRILMAEYLKQHGYQVALASDGTTMFEQISGCRPDLIVLDIMMPGEDGLSLCRRMREGSS